MNTLDIIILVSQTIAVMMICWGCYGLGKVRGEYESEMKRILAEKAKLKAKEFHEELDRITNLIIGDIKKALDSATKAEKMSKEILKKTTKK